MIIKLKNELKLRNFITIIKNNQVYFFFKNTIGSDIPSLLTESYWKKMFNQHLLSDSLFKGSVREKLNFTFLDNPRFNHFLLIDVTERSKAIVAIQSKFD